MITPDRFASIRKLEARLRRAVREIDRRNIRAAIGSCHCRRDRVEFALTGNGIGS
jgi:hypothetical protein